MLGQVPVICLVDFSLRLVNILSGGRSSMADISRRNLIQASTLLAAPPVLLTLLAGCSPTPNSEADTSQTPTPPQDAEDAKSDRQSEKQSTNGAAMKVHYLEIVSPEADALCAQYATIHGVTFAESDPNLGGARTAVLDNGGMIDIRHLIKIFNVFDF